MPNPLGEFEILVLLALCGQPGEGYGFAIQLALGINARREVSLGTVSKTLRRLEAKGLVRSRVGATRPVRAIARLVRKARRGRRLTPY